MTAKYTQKRKRQMTVFAHRGFSSKYPENTLLAFEKAIELGADYIELDVRLSKDNKMIIMHDDHLQRISHSFGKVEKKTLDKLKKVKLPMNQQIPTLREVFDLCKGKIGIEIELKVEGIALRVLDLIKEYNLESDVRISSFNHEQIRITKRLNPDIIGSVCEPLGNRKGFPLKEQQAIFLNNAAKIGADGIHVNHKHVLENLPKLVHEQGIVLNSWNIDDVSVWDYMLKIGADGIFTNNCEGLINFLDNNKKYNTQNKI